MSNPPNVDIVHGGVRPIRRGYAENKENNANAKQEDGKELAKGKRRKLLQSHFYFLSLVAL